MASTRMAWHTFGHPKCRAWNKICRVGKTVPKNKNKWLSFKSSSDTRFSKVSDTVTIRYFLKSLYLLEIVYHFFYMESFAWPTYRDCRNLFNIMMLLQHLNSGRQVMVVGAGPKLKWSKVILSCPASTQIFVEAIVEVGPDRFTWTSSKKKFQE